MVLNITWRPSKKFSPRIKTTCPPTTQPSLGWICLITGVGISDSEKFKRQMTFSLDSSKFISSSNRFIFFFDNWSREDWPNWISMIDEPPSMGSNRRVRRPCFELLWTNIFSDIAKTGGSTLTDVERTTWLLKRTKFFVQNFLENCFLTA